jgi:hypothetical protein
MHVTGFNYALLQSLSTYNTPISINTKKRSLFSATKLYKKILYNSIKHESNENEYNAQLTKILESKGIKGKCFWKFKILLYLKDHFQQIQKSDNYPKPLIFLYMIFKIGIEFSSFFIHALVILLYLS